MVFRSVQFLASGFPVKLLCVLIVFYLHQPDGYLTEERKKEDPDHGFSTFFSETGKMITHTIYMASTRRMQ